MGWMRALIRRDRLERILDDELLHHIELQTEEYVRDGLCRADAERKARKHFGAVSLVKERCRDENGITLVETLWQDLRHGARNFASQPGLTAVLLITLALGIGANTAIFSTVDSVLLRALPYADPDRLVMVWEDASFAGFTKVTPAPGNFFEWNRRNHVFAAMAATRSRSANLTGDGAPEQVAGLGVTSSFFSVLGVRPLLGRTFSEEEDRTNAPVAVISYGLWQRRYLGDPNVLGKPILLDGNKVTLIGVMGREFAFRDRDVVYWAPMGFTPADLQNRGSHFLNVLARLKPGVTLGGAREEMRVIESELAKQYAEDARASVLLMSMQEELIGDTRTGLLVLMAAAGGVLLIACSNLASLSLARTAARRREISVRVALGAGQGRLARQIFTEGIALAVVGGALGIGVALAGIRVLAGLVPAALPVTSQPALDARLLGFTLALSLVTGLLFSLLPAFQAARTPLNEALTQTGRIGMTPRGRWMRDVLVTIEVGSALVLLIGTALLLQTLVRLHAIDVGFRSDHLLVARTVLPPAKYPTPLARLAFSERVLDGIRTLPGVEGAAYVSTLPFLSQGNVRGYRVEGRPINLNEPAALYRLATSDYLKMLGVRLVEGRFFDRGDGRDAPPVVVINETFARLYWPNDSALGHRITVETPKPVWRTIVGVVRDVRERGYELASKPGVYQPAAQTALPYQTSELVVRVANDPVDVVPEVRRVIAGVDPEQPVAAVRTMDDVIDLAVAGRRQQLILLGAFAGLALLVACVGLYGLLSCGVTQRSREIGLRMALGAGAGSVIRMVMRRGMLLTAAGLAGGLGASWALTRWMKNLLYGVGPTDPATFSGVIALFTVVAAAACFVPARRASRLDPIVVLREE